MESDGQPELLGKIIELGGPEVVTFETVWAGIMQARGIKKQS